MDATLPLGRYIQCKIEERGMTKTEVIDRCGWQNAKKGLRRLDKMIRGTVLNMNLLTKLVGILDLDKDEVNRHLRLTSAILRMGQEKDERSKRVNWVPFVHVLAELSRPTSITIVAFCGGDPSRYVEVPTPVTLLPYEQQIAEVGKLLREHHVDHKGRTHFFGKIVGFVYHFTYDYGIEFSVAGEVVGKRTTPFTPPRTTLSVGNKIISGGLPALLK
jgi:hypothetical protein